MQGVNARIVSGSPSDLADHAHTVTGSLPWVSRCKLNAYGWETFIHEISLKVVNATPLPLPHFARCHSHEDIWAGVVTGGAETWTESPKHKTHELCNEWMMMDFNSMRTHLLKSDRNADSIQTTRMLVDAKCTCKSHDRSFPWVAHFFSILLNHNLQ